MTDGLYVVSFDEDAGEWVCSCGAKSGRGGHGRFLERHPKLCSERRAFAKQLAQTVRCEGGDADRQAGKVGLI
jgi:hypothetical protein